MFTATHSLFVSYFLSSVFDEIAFLSYGGRAVPDYDEEDCSGYDMPEQCAAPAADLAPLQRAIEAQCLLRGYCTISPKNLLAQVVPPLRDPCPEFNALRNAFTTKRKVKYLSIVANCVVPPPNGQTDRHWRPSDNALVALGPVVGGLRCQVRTTTVVAADCSRLFTRALTCKPLPYLQPTYYLRLSDRQILGRVGSRVPDGVRRVARHVCVVRGTRHVGGQCRFLRKLPP